jgi:hypothetical protein
MDEATMKAKQKKAMPLYLVQLVLVLFQLYILSHLTGPTALIGLESALWAWGGFVLPTVASSCMWTNEPRGNAWKRFFVQAGYQLVCFVIFGLILGAFMYS